MKFVFILKVPHRVTDRETQSVSSWKTAGWDRELMKLPLKSAAAKRSRESESPVALGPDWECSAGYFYIFNKPIKHSHSAQHHKQRHQRLKQAKFDRFNSGFAANPRSLPNTEPKLSLCSGVHLSRWDKWNHSESQTEELLDLEYREKKCFSPHVNIS